MVTCVPGSGILGSNTRLPIIGIERIDRYRYRYRYRTITISNATERL